VDNCTAVDLVLAKGNEGEVYNIGGGNERENIEITEMILNELGLGKERINYVKDRPGHDRRYSIDCAKVKKLGWQPATRLEDGLKQTVAWYQQNQAWWLKIKEKQVEFKKFYADWYK
jgi:dTDP-glucose 4,6-dehydratase